MALLVLLLIIPVCVVLRASALVLGTLRCRQWHEARLAAARARGSSPPVPSRPLRAMAVLGSGGHTSELIAVLSGVQRSRFESLTYVVAETDTISRPRLEAHEAALAAAMPSGAPACAVTFVTLPRSREVGQSYVTSVASTLRATASAVAIVFKQCPDLLVVNGPGTCVPLCWAAFARRMLFLRSPKIVFVESFARVTRLSLSGYLLYPIVDRFVVQWPQQASVGALMLEHVSVGSCSEAHPLYAASIALMVITIVFGTPSLFFFSAPYGRFHTKWSVSVPSWIGWIIMEIPSPIVFAVMLWALSHEQSWVDRSVTDAATAMWLFHYVYRSVIYPLRFKSPNKPMDLWPVLLAIFFNAANATANVYALACPSYASISSLTGVAALFPGLSWPLASLFRPWDALQLRLCVGVSIYLVGLAANRHSDGILRALRRPGGSGYGLPRGGLFEWVSAANYAGELLQWCGYAIAIATPAATLFAAATAANLVPRALAYHRDYRARFPDYPPHRKAIVPLLL